MVKRGHLAVITRSLNCGLMSYTEHIYVIQEVFIFDQTQRCTVLQSVYFETVLVHTLENVRSSLVLDSVRLVVFVTFLRRREQRATTVDGTHKTSAKTAANERDRIKTTKENKPRN